MPRPRKQTKKPTSKRKTTKSSSPRKTRSKAGRPALRPASRQGGRSRQTGKKVKLQAPKGTFDIRPEEQKYYERVKGMVKYMASAYGFLALDVPIFEDIRY